LNPGLCQVLQVANPRMLSTSRQTRQHRKLRGQGVRSLSEPMRLHRRVHYQAWMLILTTINPQRQAEARPRLISEKVLAGCIGRGRRLGSHFHTIYDLWVWEDFNCSVQACVHFHFMGLARETAALHGTGYRCHIVEHQFCVSGG